MKESNVKEVEYTDERLYTDFIRSNYTNYVQYLEHLVRELKDDAEEVRELKQMHKELSAEVERIKEDAKMEPWMHTLRDLME